MATLSPETPPNTYFMYEEERLLLLGYNPNKPRPYLFMYFTGATRRLSVEQAATTTLCTKDEE